ncbi:MAG: hypothetical protein IPN20_23715 [Haliscomenobacter sp.]|nr:hypothetical protein [Haliscomenobacter sp.]
MPIAQRAFKSADLNAYRHVSDVRRAQCTGRKDSYGMLLSLVIGQLVVL